MATISKIIGLIEYTFAVIDVPTTYIHNHVGLHVGLVGTDDGKRIVKLESYSVNNATMPSGVVRPVVELIFLPTLGIDLSNTQAKLVDFRPLLQRLYDLKPTGNFWLDRNGGI